MPKKKAVKKTVKKKVDRVGKGVGIQNKNNNGTKRPNGTRKAI